MKKIIAIVLALVMTFALCACGKAEPKQVATGEKRTDLKVQLAAEPTTLDFQAASVDATSLLAWNLNSNLLTYDLDGNIVGDLAEKWEYNDDITEWTFMLRDGIKFSDGSEITADDVVFSINRGKEMAFNSYYEQIVSCEAVSDKEIKIVLSAPNSVFDRQLAMDAFGILSKAYIEGGADLSSEAAVTSGPYYLAEWNAESDMLLKANEFYYAGIPAITDVDIVFIADQNTAMIALESNQVDYVVSILTAGDVENVKSADGIQLVDTNRTSYVMMCPNFLYEPFADANVRRAMNLAINRNDFSALLGGLCTPAGPLDIQEGIGGYIEGYGKAPVADIEKAKQYMQESGYPDGFEFELMTIADYVQIAESIQSQLKEIGITVNIKECADISTIDEAAVTGEYQGCIEILNNVIGDISGAGLIYDPDNILCLNHHTEGNEYGKALTQCVAFDGDERVKMLEESYKMVEDLVPYIGCYYPILYNACSADLNYGMQIPTSFARFATMSWK